MGLAPVNLCLAGIVVKGGHHLPPGPRGLTPVDGRTRVLQRPAHRVPGVVPLPGDAAHAPALDEVQPADDLFLFHLDQAEPPILLEGTLLRKRPEATYGGRCFRSSLPP